MEHGKKRIKVLIAKPGLDGHDRGAKVVIQALEEAGMDVIYSGLHNTIQEILKTATHELVDVIGLSIYSGAHLSLSKELLERLDEQKLITPLVLIGGNIPKNDSDKLKDFGVHGVFPTGSKFQDIVTFIQKKVKIDNE